MRLAALSVAFFFASAVHADPPPAPVSVPSGGASPTVPRAASAAAGAEPGVSGGTAAEGAAVGAVYPWLGVKARGGRLDERFREAPNGFVRVPVSDKSFAGFLRTLPLQPEGAPVLDFRGNPLYDGGHHPSIAAVAELDVGTRDLQQCADAVIRLNAEFRYGVGEREIAYRTVSGKMMSYRGFLSGNRAVASGNDIVFKPVAGAHADDHALFRGWLDEVFAWASTASLQHEGKSVGAIADVQPGDFFVMTGAPFGHAVLVLDVAKDDKGRVAILLGQSYMPAQTFQVLRPNPSSPWFIVEPGDAAVATPFWKPFPMSTLRRFS